MMEQEAKIYVAGHRGMVGSAIVRALQKAGYKNIIMRTSKELELRRQDVVEEFFAAERPDYVFLAAAKVGGIMANSKYPADFMYDNMVLEMNVIHSAYQTMLKAAVFRQQLYLSAPCSSADVGKLPFNICFGAD